ncbi:Uncharacterised protein [Raoultella ornithinolytica]|nr:Uncharacterised protein [Raoultella ornithinolytica]
MVLRPVKLNSSGNPRAKQANQRGLDDIIVINEITLSDLIPRTMHAASQLGQDHNFDVIIFQPHRLPGL